MAHHKAVPRQGNRRAKTLKRPPFELNFAAGITSATSERQRSAGRTSFVNASGPSLRRPRAPNKDKIALLAPQMIAAKTLVKKSVIKCSMIHSAHQKRRRVDPSQFDWRFQAPVPPRIYACHTAHSPPGQTPRDASKYPKAAATRGRGIRSVL